jgi:crotonobetainyl-CoA:carnitine CoA-transferase CaiB-like acyl-CoA transferase
MMDAPLAGVKVLELGEALAGPLTCTLLADFGATVIKVERPGAGDSMRTMGPQRGGVGLWWSVTGRGKRSIALDLKSPDGREALRTLAGEWADVVVENFRPGVLERNGIVWDELHAANPAVTLVRISGFGQTGPYAQRRGFGKIAEGFSGATNLTGHRGAPPVQPGYSLGDATTAMFAVMGSLLALLHRERGGEGQVIDLALYEGLLRLIEWQVPLQAHGDLPVTRNGNSFPFEDAFITDIVTCADGESIIYSAATAVHLARLREFLRGTGISTGAGGTSADVVAAVRAWAATVTSDAVLEGFSGANLVAGQVMTPQHLLTDPHVHARENIVALAHPRLGKVSMPGIVPKLSATPGAITRPAPELGDSTVEMLAEVVGFDADRIEAMLASGAAAGAAESGTTERPRERIAP